MTAATGPDDGTYCADQLRRHDHDRYLTCLFAPAARRAHLFALYAFNLEVAKTAEVVSEAMLGRIRLQWWRDAIEGIYAGAPATHAVVQPLAAAAQSHGLSRDHFERLIAAREKDLEFWQPATLMEMEAYARETSVPLIWLALEVLGERGDAARAAAESLGIAWALTGLLRSVRFDVHRKRVVLPRDLMAAHGARAGELRELRSSAALCAVVTQVAARAGEHLSELRQQYPKSPKAAQPALLLAPLAQQYLAILERAGYDPFDARVQRPDPAAAWRLTWARLRGRI